MKRRVFIKLGLLVTTAVALAAPLSAAARSCSRRPPLQPGDSTPLLPLQGSPYRLADQLSATYEELSFEDLSEEIIHHAMPDKWRHLIVLGISDARVMV